MAAGLRPDRVGQTCKTAAFRRDPNQVCQLEAFSTLAVSFISFASKHTSFRGASIRSGLMTGPIAEAIRQAVLFFEIRVVSLYTGYDSSRVKQWIHLAWSAGGCWFSCCGALCAAMALGERHHILSCELSRRSSLPGRLAFASGGAAILMTPIQPLGREIVGGKNETSPRHFS
jgi:hypothetical protein